MGTKIPELPDYIKEVMQSKQLTDEIVLDKEGNWFHNGQPFSNEKIIKFFNKSIDLTEDGIFVIHYDEFVFPIRVEDTPIFITGVRYEGFGDFEKVYINLSTGDVEELDIETLEFRDNNILYCSVKNGKFTAKFKRSPSFHIMERLDEKGGKFYLNICGKSVMLKQH